MFNVHQNTFINKRNIVSYGNKFYQIKLVNSNQFMISTNQNGIYKVNLDRGNIMKMIGAEEKNLFLLSQSTKVVPSNLVLLRNQYQVFIMDDTYMLYEIADQQVRSLIL